MKERDYQRKLITRLEDRFKGCMILKNDPTYLQGVPDLSIFYGCKYAMLEVKISENANIQPNQEYYLEEINKSGGFGRLIFPENEEVVINELEEYFKHTNWSCVSKSI